MKYLSFLFFFIVINTMYAQKYQPLVEEGKYWIYNHYASNECFQLWQTGIEIRCFSGDTIIRGLSYKKLISSNVVNNVLPYEITTKRSLCYMREDTLQRKVFMVNFDENVFPCADGNEVCIWDFGLNVGDTIKNCTYDIFYPFNFGDLTHNIVDSILILQSSWGYEQKHFFTVGMSPGQCNDPGLFVDTYIEGFGMQDGPIYKRFGTYLFKYCEGTLAECNIISSTKDDTESNIVLWTMYPNPVWDNLHIETELDIQKVEIVDQNGRIVISSFEKNINVSQLLSGIYFVKCLTTNNMYCFMKFVKI